MNKQAAPESAVKILTIEDEAPIRESIVAYLEDHDFFVLQAEDGETGLQKVRTEQPDVVLTDLRMPGMSGLAVLKEIVREFPETPVIVVSGTGSLVDVVETIRLGAWDFVAKPIHDMAILKHSIDASIEKAKLIRENREQREKLQKANEELESFNYSISHDLRSPLHAIDGFSAMLEEDCMDLLDDASKSNLRRIREATGRMQRMIEDLLLLSQLSKKDIALVKIDLSMLTHSILENLSLRDPERRVDIVIENNLTATCDDGLLRSVMENLLDNAWKYTSKTESAKIEFGRQKTLKGDAFFVRDNGAGFDMRYEKKLFGVFQRLHAEDEFPGTGVGLATVRRILNRHNGNIWAESAPGKGATFYFSLPG